MAPIKMYHIVLPFEVQEN